MLVCDTSFVSHLGKMRHKPDRYQHWDKDILRRTDKAYLAISVVTIAEARFGYAKSSWGTRKVAAEESRLASFIQIPLDFPDLDEWALLRNVVEQDGFAPSDNDLWIAATASTRGHPLVTCDRDHARLRDDLGVEVIFLPPPS